MSYPRSGNCKVSSIGLTNSRGLYELAQLPWLGWVLHPSRTLKSLLAALIPIGSRLDLVHMEALSHPLFYIRTHHENKMKIYALWPHAHALRRSLHCSSGSGPIGTGRVHYSKNKPLVSTYIRTPHLCKTNILMVLVLGTLLPHCHWLFSFLLFLVVRFTFFSFCSMILLWAVDFRSFPF